MLASCDARKICQEDQAAVGAHTASHKGFAKISEGFLDVYDNSCFDF